MTAASINNGGQAEIQGSDATAESIVLGDNQGNSGGLVVDGQLLDIGSSTCQGDIYVGNRGSGTLTITNGARINSRHGYVAAVQNPSRPASNGNVKVTGSGTIWRIYDDYDNPECMGAGLFIGAADSNGLGGTASVEVSDGGSIVVYRESADPGVVVGLSGSLTGNGTLLMDEGISSSKLVRVYGTLAPVGALTIQGNLDLNGTSPPIPCVM